MDLVRLAIIYDTSQAAGKLNDLNNHLNNLHKANASATGSTGQLKRGLEQLAFSAAGVPGPIGRVAAGLLQFGGGHTLVLGVVAGLAAIAGAYQLLTKSVRDAEKAVKATDEAFRSALSAQGPVQAANVALAAAEQKLRDLRRQAAEQAALAGPHTVDVHGRDPRSVIGTRTVPGSPIAQSALEELNHAIDTQQRVVDLARAASNKAYADLRDNAAKAAAPLEAIGDAFLVIQGRVQDLVSDPAFQEFIQSMTVGLNPKGLPGPLAAIKMVSDQAEKAKLGPTLSKSVTAAAIDAAHASDLMVAGIQGMTAAILTFVETGTFAFAQFLDNLLRVMAGDVIENFVGSLHIGGHSSAGSGKGGAGRASVSSNVTFNVQAMDAPGVAAFLQQNGGAIAAVVTSQADRSRAIRKRFWRG